MRAALVPGAPLVRSCSRAAAGAVGGAIGICFAWITIKHAPTFVVRFTARTV